MFDFRLKVFYEVALQLSFTKASQALFISQPAVTRHIRELEAQLEERLFQRKGNKVALTESGEVVLAYAKKVFKLQDELLFELGARKNNYSGTLRLGGSSTAAQYLMPPVIAAFREKFPEIKISLRSANSRIIEKEILDDEIDLGIVENNSHTAGIKYVDFFEDELIVVCNSQSTFASLDDLTLDKLREIPMVVREQGSGTLETIEAGLDSRGLHINDMNIILHLGSTEAIKKYIQEANCVGIVSKDAVETELKFGLIKHIPLRDLGFFRKYRFAIPAGPMTGLSQVFTRFCNRYYNQRLS